jgi:hypothetical protein
MRAALERHRTRASGTLDAAQGADAPVRVVSVGDIAVGTALGSALFYGTVTAIGLLIAVAATDARAR